MGVIIHPGNGHLYISIKVWAWMSYHIPLVNEIMHNPDAGVAKLC